MQEPTGSPERIPKSEILNQNERLTTKHIQTLSFLNDLANENTELKAKVQELEEQQSKCASLHALAEDSQSRIKEIQQQYLNRSDEINAMLAEKHKNEVLQLVDEKLELEKRYSEEINAMKWEIQALQQENAELMYQVENLPQQDDQAEVKLEEAEREIKRLKAEFENLRKDSENQAADLVHMQELRSQNQSLTHQLQEMNQKNDELQLRIGRLEKKIEETESSKELSTLVQKMKKKLETVVKERDSYRYQQDDFIKQMHELNSENDRLKTALIKVQKEKELVVQELEKSYLEIHSLRKQLSKFNEQQTFKEFVTIKRELNLLKDENRTLKSQTKVPSLPMLKAERPVSASKVSDNHNKVKNGKKLLALPASES